MSKRREDISRTNERGNYKLCKNINQNKERRSRRKNGVEQDAFFTYFLALHSRLPWIRDEGSLRSGLDGPIKREYVRYEHGYRNQLRLQNSTQMKAAASVHGTLRWGAFSRKERVRSTRF